MTVRKILKNKKKTLHISSGKDYSRKSNTVRFVEGCGSGFDATGIWEWDKKVEMAE